MRNMGQVFLRRGTHAKRRGSWRFICLFYRNIIRFYSRLFSNGLGLSRPEPIEKPVETHGEYHEESERRKIKYVLEYDVYYGHDARGGGKYDEKPEHEERYDERPRLARPFVTEEEPHRYGDYREKYRERHDGRQYGDVKDCAFLHHRHLEKPSGHGKIIIEVLINRR